MYKNKVGGGMKYNTDKYSKILLIFLFGALNIAIITLLIGILELHKLGREEFLRSVIAMLTVVFLNYAALQVFDDE